MSKHYLVLSTIDSKEVAEQIAHHVVEERLAACVNIISDIASVYKWKGTLERATESLLVFKSTQECLPRLIERIKDLHTYELPEVIALPIEDGHPPYLDWIVSQTTK
jgi:periplasmic divalent cation tolerance protein